MAKQKNNNEMNFQDMLSAIKADGVDEVSTGSFKFTELTMSERRKINNMPFEMIEIPVRLSNIYNDYICSHVSYTDDFSNISQEIGVDIKPFMLSKLRILTLGDKYKDIQTDSTFTLVEPTDEDFDRTFEPHIISFKQFEIFISVPKLAKDTYYNNLLINELQQFKKKKLKDEEYTKVSDMYDMYEFMKYIVEIRCDGKVLNYESLPINKKMKLIDILPQKVVSQLENYIKKVKDNQIIAFKMENNQTHEMSEMDSNVLFLSKYAMIG